MDGFCAATGMVLCKYRKEFRYFAISLFRYFQAVEYRFQPVIPGYIALHPLNPPPAPRTLRPDGNIIQQAGANLFHACKIGIKFHIFGPWEKNEETGVQPGVAKMSG